MNNYDNFGNKEDDRFFLGVNKIGRNIKKSPTHQPNIATTNPALQPHFYNINKHDFRSVVQQLTAGSPSRHSQQPPPSNPPSNRLQRIRPTKLSPINVNRPPTQTTLAPFSTNLCNPVIYSQQPPPLNAAESPISAYMRYLQHSITDSTQSHHPFPSPRVAGLPPPLPFPSPRMAGLPPPSPRMNAPFALPSPSSYMNLLSPLSPYPLFSPAYHFQHVVPLSPVFSFSPMAQPPLPSPGIGFPSPGFFNILSPGWRN